jgi:hypothetical protein
MLIAWPTEYKGDKSKNSITLSDGEIYTPVKNSPPVCPCDNCKDINARQYGSCNSGFGVCEKYMDYEHAKAIWKLTVFD